MEIAAYPDAKLEGFRINHVTIQAEKAGHIDDTDQLTLSDIKLTSADGSRLAVADNSDLHGLDTVRYLPPTQANVKP